MGVSIESYVQFVESIPQNKRLKILELGTQDIVEESVKEALRSSISNTYTNNSELFKAYLVDLGHSVISIDIMGDRGSIPVNLCQDISTWNLGRFDVITNYGTTEHVDDQYMCWKNMHNSLEVGGIIISEIPKHGHWPGHCEFYYDLTFFKEFEKIGYELTYSKDHIHPGNGALIAVTLRKVEEKEFFTDAEAFTKLVHIVPTSTIAINQYWKGRV
jgi:hypothetical protein